MTDFLVEFALVLVATYLLWSNGPFEDPSLVFINYFYYCVAFGLALDGLAVFISGALSLTTYKSSPKK
ncbi:MAG: hypothetical protein ACI83D_000084 [Planctomycetota bacterium]